MTKDWQAVADRSNEKPPEVAENVTPAPKTEEPAKLEQNEKHKIENKPKAILEDELTAAEEKICVLQKEILLVHAELENVRRRTERDIANAHKYALEKFANELLPIIDSLERSLEMAVAVDQALLQNFHAGIELTLNMFFKVLAKFDVKQLNPVNQPFNPQHHQAMAIEATPDVKPETVIKVMQKGYLLKDRLLRPAMVVVNKVQ